GTAISLTANTSDPSDRDLQAGLQLEWSVVGQGTQVATGTGADFTSTPDDNGTYVVTLTATDKDRGVATDTRTITVTNVSPPPSIQGVPSSVPEGTGISLSADISDPSGFDLQTGPWVVWQATRNGGVVAQQAGPSPDSAYFSFPTYDNGTYTVKVTVRDKD